ncbi:MAG: phosphoribosylanthranilate isomerase [Betaproteobacteria bacterium]|nr:phosphoribosylanthranilate isomerase [Betaproteobacteria bacterium]
MSVQTRTRIKMCGFTREADVDAAVQAGADAIGFVLYPPSPRALSIARAAELAARLPAFVTPVLLFVNDTPERVRAACDAVPGALLQLHGDESPDDCAEMSRLTGRPHLKAARIPLQAAPRFDLLKFAHLHSTAQAILLDAQVEGYGGGGKAFDWSLLPPSVNAHLVLSGGLTPANVADGIRLLRSRARSLAVDVSSGIEAEGPHSKGLKDAAKIRQFVDAVRAADHNAC